MSKGEQLKVGRLLLVSHGAYSSYQRVSWFVVVQPFCPDEQLKEFMATKPLSRNGFEYCEFLAWIGRKGFLAEVNEFFDEWHMGDYGKADEVSFMPCCELPGA